MTTRKTRRGCRRQPLYQESGILPPDFAERIDRLKEASGLTWSGMAQELGVDRKQLRRWRRKGVEPCGGAMLALIRFARRVPGGLEILLGEDFREEPRDDTEENKEEEEE